MYEYVCALLFNSDRRPLRTCCAYIDVAPIKSLFGCKIETEDLQMYCYSAPGDYENRCEPGWYTLEIRQNAILTQ